MSKIKVAGQTQYFPLLLDIFGKEIRNTLNKKLVFWNPWSYFQPSQWRLRERVAMWASWSPITAVILASLKGSTPATRATWTGSLPSTWRRSFHTMTSWSPCFDPCTRKEGDLPETPFNIRQWRPDENHLLGSRQKNFLGKIYYHNNNNEYHSCCWFHCSPGWLRKTSIIC